MGRTRLCQCWLFVPISHRNLQKCTINFRNDDNKPSHTRNPLKIARDAVHGKGHARVEKTSVHKLLSIISTLYSVQQRVHSQFHVRLATRLSLVHSPLCSFMVKTRFVVVKRGRWVCLSCERSLGIPLCLIHWLVYWLCRFQCWLPDAMPLLIFIHLWRLPFRSLRTKSRISSLLCPPFTPDFLPFNPFRFDFPSFKTLADSWLWLIYEHTLSRMMIRKVWRFPFLRGLIGVGTCHSIFNASASTTTNKLIAFSLLLLAFVSISHSISFLSFYIAFNFFHHRMSVQNLNSYGEFLIVETTRNGPLTHVIISRSIRRRRWRTWWQQRRWFQPKVHPHSRSTKKRSQDFDYTPRPTQR